MSRTYYWTDAEGHVVRSPVPREQESARAPVYTDLYMSGDISPVDGSDISTRSKRREHMRAHNLSDAGDFTQHLKQKAQERLTPFSNTQQRESRIAAASRAWDTLTKR